MQQQRAARRQHIVGCAGLAENVQRRTRIGAREIHGIARQRRGIDLLRSQREIPRGRHKARRGLHLSAQWADAYHADVAGGSDGGAAKSLQVEIAYQVHEARGDIQAPASGTGRLGHLLSLDITRSEGDVAGAERDLAGSDGADLG